MQRRLVSDQQRKTSSSLLSSSAHDIERALKHQKGMHCPTAEMVSEIVGREAPPQSNVNKMPRKIRKDEKKVQTEERDSDSGFQTG